MKRILALTTAVAALGVTAHAQLWNNDAYTYTPTKPLYERLGGVHKVAIMVDTFVTRLSMDKTVLMNERCAVALSKPNLPYMKFNMTSYFAQQWGGPQKYMGPDMVEWHRQAMITDAEWAAGDKIFRWVLDDMKVGMDEQKEVGEFFVWFRKEMKKPSMGSKVELSMGAEGSLYQRLGGGGAIAAVVDEFVNRLAMDPTIGGNKNVVKSLTSGRVSDAGLKYLVTEQLIMAAGGPATYSGRDMAKSHKGLMITEAEWEAGAKILKSVLDDFKVPAKEQGEIFSVISGTKKDIVGR